MAARRVFGPNGQLEQHRARSPHPVDRWRGESRSGAVGWWWGPSPA